MECESLSDQELYALIRPLQSKRKRFTNWALSFTVRPRIIYSPTTQTEVQLLVEYARREGTQVRAIGSGHSPSDLACSTGILLSFDKMDEILDIDKEKRTMTVQAGIKLYQLIEAARAHQLALPNLGSIADQSLAGAVSTSTHGAGLTYGTISTMIRSATLVIGDGSVVTCSREQEPDLFYASMCGLGATGIFTRLTVQLVPLYDLSEEHFTLDFDDFLDLLDEGDGSATILGKAEHVRAYWVSHLGKVKMSLLQHVPLTTPHAPVGATWYNRWIRDWLVGRHLHQLGLLFCRFVYPNFIYAHAHFIWHFAFSNHPHPFLSLFGPTPRTPHPAYLKQSDRHHLFVDSYDRLFTYDCGPRQYTFECAVPVQRLKETLLALDEWMQTERADRKGLRHHFPVEIRPCEADDIWLSPAYKKRIVYIGICQYKPYKFDVPWQDFFAHFESICIAHDGRPHWAKAHHCSPYQLSSMYPRFNDFVRLRDKVDPRGLFMNPYTSRHLKGLIGSEYDYARFLCATPL